MEGYQQADWNSELLTARRRMVLIANLSTSVYPMMADVFWGCFVRRRKVEIWGKKRERWLLRRRVSYFIIISG